MFLTDLQSSFQQTEHVNRFLNQFAAGTLMKYFGALIHWYSICLSSRVDPWHLSDVGLADLLSIHKLARRSDGQGPGVSVTLKSLRWAVSQLQVVCLRDCVYGRIVSSFGKQRSSADRRETLPFSLFILCVWEKQILRSTTSDVDVIILSTFLLLTWSSLRFADAQRCNIDGLCYTDQILRGICWQTKTVSNLAWGLIGNGFLSHGTFNWLHKFLRTLDRIYHEQGQSTSIDFMFPSCTDEGIRMPIQAMQYAECLYFLRKYLRMFWHKSSSEDVTLSAQSYTVHGLKSTMLSYAAQLQLPDEMRRIQGKHRAVQASTRLYSRDDVSSAIHLQQIVREKVLGGWRPSTPVARGGQAPLVEPKFSLDRYRSFSFNFRCLWKYHSWERRQMQWRATIHLAVLIPVHLQILHHLKELQRFKSNPKTFLGGHPAWLACIDICGMWYYHQMINWWILSLNSPWMGLCPNVRCVQLVVTSFCPANCIYQMLWI